MRSPGAAPSACRTIRRRRTASPIRYSASIFVAMSSSNSSWDIVRSPCLDRSMLTMTDGPWRNLRSTFSSERPDELVESAVHRLDLADPRVLIDPRQQHEASPGNALSDVAAMVRLYPLLISSVQNQRRDPDRGQDLGQVDLRVHAHQPARHPGAGAETEVAGIPADVAVITGETRVDHLESGAGRPRLLERVQPALESLGCPSPWVVGRPENAPERRVQHEPGHSLGMARRRQRTHRAPLRHPEQHGPLRPRSGHDRNHVVDTLWKSRPLDHRVGQPGAALVEDD